MVGKTGQLERTHRGGPRAGKERGECVPVHGGQEGPNGRPQTWKPGGVLLPLTAWWEPGQGEENATEGQERGEGQGDPPGWCSV